MFQSFPRFVLPGFVFFQFCSPFVFPTEGQYLQGLLPFASESRRKCEEMVSPRWKWIRPNRVDFVKICSDFLSKFVKTAHLGLSMGCSVEKDLGDRKVDEGTEHRPTRMWKRHLVEIFQTYWRPTPIVHLMPFAPLLWKCEHKKWTKTIQKRITQTQANKHQQHKIDTKGKHWKHKNNTTTEGMHVHSAMVLSNQIPRHGPPTGGGPMSVLSFLKRA